MVEWIQANWNDLIAILLQVIGAASLVVRITPTPKDDAVFGKIYTFISKFIALNKKV